MEAKPVWSQMDCQTVLNILHKDEQFSVLYSIVQKMYIVLNTETCSNPTFNSLRKGRQVNPMNFVTDGRMRVIHRYSSFQTNLSYVTFS